MSEDFYQVWQYIELPLLFIAAGTGPAIGLMVCLAVCRKHTSLSLRTGVFVLAVAGSLLITALLGYPWLVTRSESNEIHLQKAIAAAPDYEKGDIAIGDTGANIAGLFIAMLLTGLLHILTFGGVLIYISAESATHEVTSQPRAGAT